MKVLVVLMMFVSLSAFANEELLEDVVSGTQEFQVEEYTQARVQELIYEDMLVSCENGLCSIFALDESGDEFTMSFDAGVGSEVGTTNKDGDSAATVVGPYVGMNLSYTKKNCRQQVLIPRPLYIAINTYFYGLMTETGGTRRVFNPSDEAMIILYSTIMQQANGCN